MSNHKKYKKNAPATLQLLRELEISLRTNHVGWVKQFIRDYSGLDALVDFLKFACWGLVVSTINVKVRKYQMHPSLLGHYEFKGSSDQS